MGLENVKCFNCQEYGHLAKDCKTKFYEQEYAAEHGDGKPPWCQQPHCDRETRLVYQQTDNGLKAHRCYQCHPQSQTLPEQFGKCRTCRTVVYKWDLRSECGKHTPIGRQLKCLIIVKGQVVKEEPIGAIEK